MNAVKITWSDATSIDQWEHIADLPEDDHPCVTIGILVKTSKHYYYVANTVGKHTTAEDLLSTGVIMIPRKWVFTFEELDIVLDFEKPKNGEQQSGE